MASQHTGWHSACLLVVRERHIRVTEFPLHTHGSSAGKLRKNVSHLTLQVGLQSGAAALANNLAIVEKLKIALLYHPSEFYSRYVLRRNGKRAPQKLDRIVHCSIIPKESKVRATRMSAHWWRDKTKKKWSPHAMECYSAVKRNEVLIHGTACWPLKMLSERRKTQSLHNVWIHLLKCPE